MMNPTLLATPYEAGGAVVVPGSPPAATIVLPFKNQVLPTGPSPAPVTVAVPTPT